MADSPETPAETPRQDEGGSARPDERRISLEDRATNNELRRRLESVAQQVIEQQLTTLSDVGTVERGGTSPAGINELKAHIIYFGTSALPDPQVNPGTGTQRLCMSS